MCSECWASYADVDLEWHDDIPTAARLVELLYEQPDGAAGGPLHVVLDDWNLEGGLDLYQPELFSTATRVVATAVAEIMRPMEPRQRAEVLRVAQRIG